MDRISEDLYARDKRNDGSNRERKREGTAR